jgi:hypothetical protein
MSGRREREKMMKSMISKDITSIYDGVVKPTKMRWGKKEQYRGLI